MLIGVAGRGWYKEEGKPAVKILPGTVIHIPANVKHWQGAAADSWFAHLAFDVPGEISRTNGWSPSATRNTANWDRKENKSEPSCLELCHGEKR